MPKYEESRRWRVVAWPLYCEKRALRFLRGIAPLRNHRGEVSPSRWWSVGRFTHPARPKVVVVAFRPGGPVDLESLVSRAAAALERGSGKELDWVWGVRGGRAYLAVKTLAKDRKTGRNALFRLDRETLQELVSMTPGMSSRRERRVERER